MVQRNAFLDPSGVLKTHGFVETNRPGDTRLPVSEAFNLEPDKWRWDGSQWVSFIPPPSPPTALAVTLDAAIAASPPIDPRIKAVFVEWRKQIL